VGKEKKAIDFGKIILFCRETTVVYLSYIPPQSWNTSYANNFI